MEEAVDRWLGHPRWSSLAAAPRLHMKVATITCQASLSSHWSELTRRLLFSLCSSKLPKVTFKKSFIYLGLQNIILAILKKYADIL